MCLGVPGRVLAIDDEGGLPMAQVDFGGIRRDVCLVYLPETQVGSYVIVHVGFAITEVDEAEAQRTLEVLRTMDGDALPDQGVGLAPADLHDRPSLGRGGAHLVHESAGEDGVAVLGEVLHGKPGDGVVATPEPGAGSPSSAARASLSMVRSTSSVRWASASSTSVIAKPTCTMT